MSTSRLSSPWTHTYQRCVHPMTSSPHPHHHITPQQSDIVTTFLHCHPRDQQDFTRMSEGNVCVCLGICMYCMCVYACMRVCICAYVRVHISVHACCDVCVCCTCIVHCWCVCPREAASSLLLPPPEIALQPIVGRAKLDMTYENGSLLLVVRHVRIVVMIYSLPLPLPPHVIVM